ncbi:MAG: hypothetical protein ABSG01_03685 [Anaerolineales bacterium]|jgi:hypothetical protein
MKKHSRFPLLLSTLLVSIAVIGLACWYDLPSAAAGDPLVQIELVPTSLQVPAGGNAEALLIIRNNYLDAISNINLTYFPQDSVSIVTSPLTIDSIPAGETRTLNLTVTQKTPTTINENVYLELGYDRQSSSSGNLTADLEVETLQVSFGPTPAGGVFTASAQMAGGTTVSEKQPGLIYLFLKNTTSEVLNVMSIQANANNQGLKVSPSAKTPLELEPFDQVAIPYLVELENNSALQPGKILVDFDITVKTSTNGQIARDSVTQEVNTGVLGESDLLTLLGVPSILVLPGFLMVVTFLWLWSWKPEPKTTIDAKDPRFWLAAITLSMGMAALYPHLTGLLVKMGLLDQVRDYLSGFGLVDIVLLWVISILVAVIIYLAALRIDIRIEKYKTRFIPGKNDKPLSLLRKLHGQGLGLRRPEVSGAIFLDKTVDGYLLEKLDEGQKAAWIGPLIYISWLTDDERTKDKRRQMQPLLNSETPEELAMLIKLLEQEDKKSLKLDWNKNDPNIQGPCYVTLINVIGNPVQFIQDKPSDG